MKFDAQSSLGFLVIAILAILILPLGGTVIDALLALSMAVATLALLVALRVQRPLDFSVFPAFLLISTLFRLGLNVATTRLILLKGGEGEAATGSLIRAFGEFAVGGSVLVGAVVFLILLVVNFMVITKGSTRVSEVAARFTLDALPGKQMSIDADLAAGAISEKEAQDRRARLSQEAEFFGAMDGASKFVRGDAVAGLIITGINLVGGLVAGVLQHDMSLPQAMSSFTVLTVGDGLLSQLPALFISTAAGIVITRAGPERGLGAQLVEQMLGHPAVLTSVAVVLVLIGLLPGMPLLAFAGIAAVLLFLARRAQKKKREVLPVVDKKAEGPPPQKLEDLLHLEAVEVELGVGLVRLIEGDDSELPGRVTALRKQLASELGIVLPQIHLKDSLTMPADQYRVLFRGAVVGEGTAYSDRKMVIDPTGAVPDIKGITQKEPTFGLDVKWIHNQEAPVAQRKGYVLVDVGSVITTHLAEVLKRNAFELVGRQETQELLNVLARTQPKLVEDVVPQIVTLGELASVVRNLLQEGVSVRDFRTLVESVADAAPKSKSLDYLTESARARLCRTISTSFAPEGILRAVVLTADAELVLRSALGQSDGSAVLAPDLVTAQALLDVLREHSSKLASEGSPCVVLAPPDLRRPLFLFGSRFVKELVVVAARELVPGTQIDRVGTVSLLKAA